MMRRRSAMFTGFGLALLTGIMAGVVGTCHEQRSQCWSSEYHFAQVAATVPCFERNGKNLCHCSNTTANCSLTHGALFFLPNVSTKYQHYQVLNFSYNNLTNISTDFFANASQEVSIIDLYNNGLMFIASGAFRNLTNLTTLLLGGSNYVGYDVMPGLLALPSLTNLSFSCVGLPSIPKEKFENSNQSKVMFFDLSWNFIGSLNLSIFKPLRQLKKVVLWHNKIYELTTAHLSSWEDLTLSSNRIYEFPQTCYENNDSRSLFPNLKKLSLDYNMIECIGTPVCLPNLTLLSLNFNKFQYLRKNTFSLEHFPALLDLRLLQMEDKIAKVDPYFVNNSEVRMILFALNGVDFSSKVVDKDAFAGCSKLQILEMSENNFQEVTDLRLQRLLEPVCGSLRILYLGSTGLSITSQTFKITYLTKLTELYLFKNSMTSVPAGAFDHLTSLKILQMDHNNIKTISESTFSQELQRGLEEIRLGANPFQCDCDILWFQEWFKANKTTLFKDFSSNGYQCKNVHNVSLDQFVINDQTCMLGSDAAAFTISVICVLITFLLLFTILFRFRWHMRLWLYEVCRGRHQRRVRDRRFRYDVFVSYAEENAPWILHELLPRLEGNWGLRMCVHQRDFVPGKHIVDNISDCVNESSRVLLVFSPFFAQSEWCQFELKYCQACVMERDDVMLLVMMQETEARHLTGAMMAVLRTTTYVEWADLPEARASFWGRLRLALEDEEGCEED